MALLDQASLEELVNKLSMVYFKKPYIDEVRFNSRLRTTGGRYIPSKRLIELNPKYAIEMSTEEFQGIIKHELCHYHLHIEGKGYKHGDADFKQLLKETNSPRYCRPLPSEESSYKYHYICKKCEMLYKRKRRINTAKYRCGKCRGEIHLSIKKTNIN